MARRVFISFLGTSNYVATRYQLEGKEPSGLVRFVQQALAEELCKDWTANDVLLIFTTEEAYRKNWLDKHSDTGSGQDKIFESGEEIGLQTKLTELNLQARVERHVIQEGLNENDIWSIFETVYNTLHEGDQIYFDVTHAFRSIPLFAIPLFNYARFMKKTQLVAIYYGAFEKLGPAFLVRNMPLEERIAPVIDLTGLVNLQATNVAVSNFVEFGRVGDMDILSHSNHQDEASAAFGAIQEVKKQLEYLDYYMLTCDMAKIRQGRFMESIENKIGQVEESTLVRPSEKILLRKVLDELKYYGFVGQDSISNIEAAIFWSFNHGMIQQCYTLGEEYIITRACKLIESELVKIDLEDVDRMIGSDAYRDYVGAVLSLARNSTFRVNNIRMTLSPAEKVEMEALGERLKVAPWVMKLKKAYNTIRKNRNALNHANGRRPIGNNADRNARTDMKAFREEFRASFLKCLEALQAEEKRRK